MKIAITALLLGFAASLHAQAPACNEPAARELDFWIGTWDLGYVQAGKAGTSRNRISKVLDGCALLEEFDGPPGTPLVGRSYSVYDKATRQWRQTWVDNSGGYLDFTGGMQDGRMVLAREFRRGDKLVKQRMVFQDVQADSLKWLWQASQDGGATWTTAWEIDYRRVK
jgi:hypothetical protein